MPTATLRHHGGRLSYRGYPFIQYPWTHLPREVDWVMTAVTFVPGASNAEATSYTDLWASLASECDAIVVAVDTQGQNGANTACLLDIATGIATAEVNVVTNACIGYSNTQSSKGYCFPVRVAKGTRVSIRAQSVHATPATARIRAVALKSPFGFRSPPALVTIGDANSATSRGTAITTDDTWTEVTAATTGAYQALVLTYGGNSDTGLANAADQSISLGVGASGSETEILRGGFETTTGELHLRQFSALSSIAAGPFAKGIRVAVKGSSASGNQLDAVVFGVPLA